MQCPHCAHPDSIRYGTSRGVQRFRCQACRRIFQTLRRGKDPALKQQACQHYLEGMGMRAIGRVLGIHHKTLSRWLVQAAQAIPARPPETEACSFIEIDELCTFIAKKNLNVGSGQLQIPSLARSLALSVEEGRSKLVRSFGSRSSTCRRWAMARTC